MDAAWCSCIAKQRTFVCPSCLACFCNAPHSFTRAFWYNAPGELWARRVSDRPEASQHKETPDVRPLVLIVDDDPDVRLFATGAVTALGYGVIAADCAETALRLTWEQRPDVVLSDALMPRVDGRELCHRIKSSSELSSTRVVIMTAVYKAGRYRTEAKKTFGADAFVSKPLQVVQLAKILEQMLSPVVEAS